MHERGAECLDIPECEEKFTYHSGRVGKTITVQGRKNSSQNLNAALGVQKEKLINDKMQLQCSQW